MSLITKANPYCAPCGGEVFLLNACIVQKKEDEEAGEERNREREVRANERDKLVHPSHTHMSSLSSSSSIQLHHHFNDHHDRHHSSRSCSSIQ